MFDLSSIGLAWGSDGPGGGADESDSGFLQCLGERGVLRQEAVAGVDSLSAGILASLDDPVGKQVTFGARRAPHPNGLIGHLHVQRAPVGIRIDRNGLDSHSRRGLENTAGDLATVGNQYFFKHD